MKKIYPLLICLLSVGFSYAQSKGTVIKSAKNHSVQQLDHQAVMAQPVQLDKAQRQNLKVNTSIAPQVQNRVSLLSKPQYERLDKISSQLQKIADRGNGQLRVAQPQQKAPQAITNDTTLYEGFEDWDGTTPYWIPSGWTKEDLSELGEDFSWKPAGGVSMGKKAVIYPYRGSTLLFIEPAYIGTDQIYFFEPSEEWLETPAFTPKQYDKLYFKLNYNAGYMLINYPLLESSKGEEAVFDQINQEIEVHISTNGGMSWTKVWTVLDDAKTYSSDQLFDVAAYGASWSSFSIDLANYVGQNIMVGFRCNNIQEGGIFACLDEIRVSPPHPEAFYRRPQGYFYWTLSPEYYTVSALFGPAYTPATWRNYSNRESEDFNWTFTDPETTTGYDQIDLQDIQPTLTYPMKRMKDLPILEASATGAIPSTYQWAGNYLQTGGSTIVQIEGLDEPTTLGAGNYDINLGMDIGRFSNQYPDGTLFGSGNEPFWNEEKIKLNGIANYFEKPLSKYIFDQLWINSYKFSGQPAAEMHIIIHRVVNGYLADTIATATCLGSEVQAVNLGKDKETQQDIVYYNIPFSFEPYLEIEDAILVEFKDYLNPSTVSSIAPILQSGNSPTGDCYAYILYTAEGQLLLAPLSSVFGWYSSFFFNMNVTHDFLHSTDKLFDAPVEGETKSFYINCYYFPQAWWYDDTKPDWVIFEEALVDTETGVVELPVTVDPLPADTDGRNYNLKIHSPGASLVIQIKQGNADYDPSGISTVTTKATQVIRNGSVFELTYPAAAKSVAVYNLTGQKVAEYALNANGHFSMPAANLTQGVYVLKFNGTNVAVKVIK
ncbi:MAG: T9SS type A sorting domain-containing protein [Candidatus Symbiothrix sp.]|jgi:hypothetical protein|nr:T9SS type A sorting domain-containing protein [Candidatus Symbiothrix sp.]